MGGLEGKLEGVVSWGGQRRARNGSLPTAPAIGLPHPPTPASCTEPGPAFPQAATKGQQSAGVTAQPGWRADSLGTCSRWPGRGETSLLE